jgi:hypothetical protein
MPACRYRPSDTRSLSAMGPYQLKQRSDRKWTMIELRRTGIPLAVEKGIFPGDAEPAHPLQMLT